MNAWEVVTGIILLAIGIAVFWQSYNTIAQCGSVLGKIWTALTSIFGGTAAQSCYNAQLAEIGGGIVALIGLGVAYMGATGKKAKR